MRAMEASRGAVGCWDTIIEWVPLRVMPVGLESPVATSA
jgi:hypothetical protein